MAWCHQEWSHYLSLINFNSLWPSDAIWREGSGSTLVQVMACCLTAPSHYLNQCRLMISEVLWHSPDSNFTENTQDIYHWNEFESYYFETVITSPRGQWVNSSCQGNSAKKWCDKKLLQSQNCFAVYSHLLQICTQNRNIANKAVLPYLSIYSIKLWQTRPHSTQSVGNMPPPSPQHLLPHILQIMPRNPKYDQFQPKGHHNMENSQSTTKMPGNPKFYPFH